MSDRDQRFSEDNPQQQNPSEGSYVIEEPSVVVPLKGQFQQKTIKKNQIHLFSGFTIKKKTKQFFCSSENLK